MLAMSACVPTSSADDTSPRSDEVTGSTPDISGETAPPSSDDADSAEASGDTETFVVVKVVDGDTVDLDSGDTVRLGGIDSPEVGQCGHDQATRKMQQLVLDKTVTLAETDEDHDKYGRLLRYIDVDGKDAGLEMIKSGLAIARYDSRDGYGFHPREPRYIEADAASPNYTCKAKAAPLVDKPKPTKPKNCAPGYTPCVAPYPPDLDCPDIGHPVTVTGGDPHRLDRDGDGIACEWS